MIPGHFYISQRLTLIILPERNSFRKRQEFTLLEGYTEVDVYHLGSSFVDENITQMSVSQTQNIACD